MRCVMLENRQSVSGARPCSRRGGMRAVSERRGIDAPGIFRHVAIVAPRLNASKKSEAARAAPPNLSAWRSSIFVGLASAHRAEKRSFGAVSR